MMTQLIRRGLWDQNKILDDIIRNRYVLIIKSRFSAHPDDRWTKEIHATTERYYKKYDTFRCFELSSFKHMSSELDVYIRRDPRNTYIKN